MAMTGRPKDNGLSSPNYSSENSEAGKVFLNCSYFKKAPHGLLYALLAISAGQAIACANALVAQTGQTGQSIVIGDYDCHYPERMVFKLDAKQLASDGSVVPQAAVPFTKVCKEEPNGAFSCGPKAPFDLANTRWQPVSTEVWACKSENFRPPKWVCSKGCKPETKTQDFYVDAYECKQNDVDGITPNDSARTTSPIQEEKNPEKDKKKEGKKYDENFEELGTEAATILVIILLGTLAGIYFTTKKHGQFFNIENILKTSRGMAFFLLALTVLSVVVGAALAVGYRALNFDNDFGQGSGSLIQAVWGSAATIAAAYVAIMLALRAQQLSEATLKLEKSAQLRELQQYAREIKTQLRNVTAACQKAFAEMRNSTNNKDYSMEYIFAANIIGKVFMWGRSEAEAGSEVSFLPKEGSTATMEEMIHIYHRLRCGYLESIGYSIDKPLMFRRRNKYLLRVRRNIDSEDKRNAKIWKAHKDFFQSPNAKEKETLVFERKSLKDGFALWTTSSDFFRKAIDFTTREASANDKFLLQDLSYKYAIDKKTNSQLVYLYETFNSVLDTLKVALDDVEKSGFVMDLLSENSREEKSPDNAYLSFSLARDHLHKVRRSFEKCESGTGVLSEDGKVYLASRYSLSRLIHYSLQKDPFQDFSNPSIDFRFWLIFFSLPAGFDEGLFKFNGDFAFVANLTDALKPLTKKPEDLSNYFSWNDNSKTVESRQSEGDVFIVPFGDYREPKQFCEAIEEATDLRRELVHLWSRIHSKVSAKDPAKDSGDDFEDSGSPHPWQVWREMSLNLLDLRGGVLK